jgi:hypothetical protein
VASRFQSAIGSQAARRLCLAGGRPFGSLAFLVYERPMEKWKRQLIRYHFHYSARRLNIEAAYTVKHPHIPSALYKYREFCDRHKDALCKGVLRRSSPDRFNDPYDTGVYFDQNRFLMEDQSREEFMTSIDEMKHARALEAGESWSPKPIKKPIQQGEWRRKLADNLLEDQPEHVREAMRHTIDSWFGELNERIVRDTSERLRAGYSVLSLCENATSVLMWSHYSDSHKGFCIEYDLSALDGDDLRRRLCYPVFYRRKLTDATRYLARRDPRDDFNNLFGIFMCLLKSDEWAYEREWRIVAPVGPSGANAWMNMPKPKSVILGALVQPADEEWMRTFCETNGVALKRAIQRHKEFRLEIRDADADAARGPDS